MPRGSPKGGNNNVLKNAGADLTPDELQRLTQNALDVYRSARTLPDLHNPQEVNAAIEGYFASCMRNNLRPGNLGLYAALGMSRQDYNALVSGRLKSKASPESIDMMKNAVRAIGSYREGLALEGKVHPTTYIFMSKNYDGLEDNTRIEVSADTGNAARLTPEQVARQIERDIPIDVEFDDT